MTQKPLFIPLKTAYFDAFENGTKTHEYRAYGGRWNGDVCKVGRPVTLSHGYGKKRRLTGRISSFDCTYATALSKEVRQDIFSCYGTINLTIAVIGITIDRSVTNPPIDLMAIRRQRLGEQQFMYCVDCGDDSCFIPTVIHGAGGTVVTGLLCVGPKCPDEGSFVDLVNGVVQQ